MGELIMGRLSPFAAASILFAAVACSAAAAPVTTPAILKCHENTDFQADAPTGPVFYKIGDGYFSLWDDKLAAWSANWCEAASTKCETTPVLYQIDYAVSDHKTGRYTFYRKTGQMSLRLSDDLGEADLDAQGKCEIAPDPALSIAKMRDKF